MTKHGTKIYKAQVAGFSNTLESLDAVREWVNDLRARFNIEGETLTIYAGRRFGDCDEYRAEYGTKTLVIGE